MKNSQQVSGLLILRKKNKTGLHHLVSGLLVTAARLATYLRKTDVHDGISKDSLQRGGSAIFCVCVGGCGWCACRNIFIHDFLFLSKF